MRTLLVALLAVGMLAATASAQPWNARGTFNSWGETQMNDDGDGSWSLQLTGRPAGAAEKFKVAFNDWAQAWPVDDLEYRVPASGNVLLHFYPGAVTPDDGWVPNTDRVGYEGTTNDWEIMGSFNGWADGTDTAERQMTLSGGIYSVDYTIASAGQHWFKFRESGSWDVSIGHLAFGGNIELNTTNPNETWRFELDLVNGRQRWFFVPEPATAVLLGFGALVMLRRRR